MITTIQIEFRVRALGTPKPSIQWYKDDLEIFSCDRIEMREEEDGGAVVLKGARYVLVLGRFRIQRIVNRFFSAIFRKENQLLARNRFFMY